MCYGISEAYKESTSCRMEAQYAHQQEKDMVKIRTVCTSHMIHTTQVHTTLRMQVPLMMEDGSVQKAGSGCS